MTEKLQMYRLSSASQQAYESQLEQDAKKYAGTDRGDYDDMMLESIQLETEAQQNSDPTTEDPAMLKSLQSEMYELQQEDPSCTKGTQFQFKANWISV